MSVKRFAAQMRVSIEEFKTQGITSLSCDNIIAYLNNVENSPHAEPSIIDLERYKADLQNVTEKLKHEYEITRESFRATLTAGQSAIKSSFLMNGGGAIALLAFITHLAQFKAEKVTEFSGCLFPFVLGVLAITMTSGFTYVSQWCYAHNTPGFYRVGYWLNIFCVLLGLGSYVLFIWGVLSTSYAFETYM